jgi:hypothetical protein
VRVVLRLIIFFLSQADQEMRKKREEEELRRRKEEDEKRKLLEEATAVKSKGLSQMVANIFGRGGVNPPAPQQSAIPTPGIGGPTKATAAAAAGPKPLKKKTSIELMPPPKILPAHKNFSSGSFSSSSFSSSPLSSSSDSLGSACYSPSPSSSPMPSSHSPFQVDNIFKNEFALPKSPARNVAIASASAKEEFQYTISPYWYDASTHTHTHVLLDELARLTLWLAAVLMRMKMRMRTTTSPRSPFRTGPSRRPSLPRCASSRTWTPTTSLAKWRAPTSKVWPLASTSSPACAVSCAACAVSCTVCAVCRWLT